ncbi:hypothetical protein RSOL_375010, partial [Rhizoctonia solani AG-3 Rhs1AP]
MHNPDIGILDNPTSHHLCRAPERAHTSADSSSQRHAARQAGKERKIRIPPKDAKAKLLGLKRHLNEICTSHGLNYSDFATYSKDGKVRSEAESISFLAARNRDLSDLRRKVRGIPTHNDQELVDLKARTELGIKDLSGKVVAERKRIAPSKNKPRPSAHLSSYSRSGDTTDLLKALNTPIPRL